VTCREFADFMADYLSGELSADARITFEHHLALCANCRNYLTSYEETVKLGRPHSTTSMPPSPPRCRSS